jgi:hypothetical protein
MPKQHMPRYEETGVAICFVFLPLTFYRYRINQGE